MDPRRPTLLSLEVRDLDRSLAFWHDLLGLPIKLRCEDHAELQTETVLLNLRRSEGATPGTSPALGWEVQDLDAAAAKLEGQGVTVGPVQGGGMGGLRRRFHDPDGHALELITHEG